MSLTSLGIASMGLLSRGDIPARHIAAEGLLRGGEITQSGGGSGVGRLQNRKRRPSLGLGAYFNLMLALDERAKAVKAALDDDKDLKAEVSKAVKVATEETNAPPVTDEETTRSPAFNRLAIEQIEASAVSVPPEIPIEEILRWYEWLNYLERLRDEEEVAILLLMM